MNGQVESLRRFLAAQPSKLRHGAPGGTVVVASGKGGSGTSTVAALLALAAAKQGREVLLVDADGGLGALHLLFGVGPGPGIHALRGGAVLPRDLLVPVMPGLHLATAGEGDDRPTAAERRLLLRRLAAIYPEFDAVVVDGGSRLEGIFGACAAGAGALLALMEPGRVALAATHALVKTAAVRVPLVPVTIAVNRCEDAEARAAFALLDEGVRHFLAREIAFGGALPDDAGLRAAIDAGGTVQEADADSPLAAAVSAIGGRVLSVHSFTGPGSAGPLGFSR